jgi:hypothetical protein
VTFPCCGTVAAGQNSKNGRCSSRFGIVYPTVVDDLRRWFLIGRSMMELTHERECVSGFTARSPMQLYMCLYRGGLHATQAVNEAVKSDLRIAGTLSAMLCSAARGEQQYPGPTPPIGSVHYIWRFLSPYATSPAPLQVCGAQFFTANLEYRLFWRHPVRIATWNALSNSHICIFSFMITGKYGSDALVELDFRHWDLLIGFMLSSVLTALTCFT